METTERPTKRQGRNHNPPAVTKAKQHDLLELIAATGQIRPSCQKLGIDPTAPYQWASKSEQFAKRFEEAKKSGEKVLLDRYEEQIDSRVFAGKEDPQSAVLTMFRTKRLDPRYRDNAPNQLNISGPVLIQFGIDVGPQPVDSTPKITR